MDKRKMYMTMLINKYINVIPVEWVIRWRNEMTSLQRNRNKGNNTLGSKES